MIAERSVCGALNPDFRTPARVRAPRPAGAPAARQRERSRRRRELPHRVRAGCRQRRQAAEGGLPRARGRRRRGRHPDHDEGGRGGFSAQHDDGAHQARRVEVRVGHQAHDHDEGRPGGRRRGCGDPVDRTREACRAQDRGQGPRQVKATPARAKKKDDDEDDAEVEIEDLEIDVAEDEEAAEPGAKKAAAAAPSDEPEETGFVVSDADEDDAPVQQVVTAGATADPVRTTSSRSARSRC